MDFASLSLVIAGLAFVVTIFNSFIELKSIRITQRIQDWLGHESEVAAMERENQPSIVEEFDAYLMEEDPTSGVTRIEAIGATIGKKMYEGLHFSGMQQKSVDARAVNTYTQDIHKAVKGQMSPQYKILFKIAEKLGFDLDEIIDKEELPQFLAGLENNGIGMDMVPSNINNGWKLR